MKNKGQIGILVLALSSNTVWAEWRGNAGVESRWFTEESENSLSVSINPEAYWQSESGSHQISSEFFARYDDLDDERSHADIRELKWTSVFDSYEIHVGVGRVFWGVTESLHLVDVINQTDQVESVDGEDKLGQPMLHLSTFHDWGTVDFFLLPYFRERTFNSPEGRLSGSVSISDEARFESGAEEEHVDFALRYSQSVSIWDFGLSYFDGTNRDPKLTPYFSSSNQLELFPYYDQMQQVSLDAQATLDAWLLKLEVLHRKDSLSSYLATVTGFEYTVFGITETGADLGFLLEYQYDDRDDMASALGQNDFFLGGRFTLNDIQDTQFLAGVVMDMDNDENLAFVEASRRFGDAWRISLDARIFSGFDEGDFQFLNQQDHATLTIEYHF